MKQKYCFKKWQQEVSQITSSHICLDIKAALWLCLAASKIASALNPVRHAHKETK